MSDDPSLQKKMVEIGLEDPFIRAIVGMVAVAVAASFVITIIGDATRAIFAVGAALMFGVVLVVLRVLMKHVDDKIVWTLCLVTSCVIILVFIAFVVIAVPAVTLCWPAAYSETLGLKGCTKGLVGPGAGSGPFTPIPYKGTGITQDDANKVVTVYVFYRASRFEDAERVVGAFVTAGYAAKGVESNLNEVDTPDNSAGFTLIKTTPGQQAKAAELARVTKLAIPFGAARVTPAAAPATLSKGDAQIDLF